MSNDTELNDNQKIWDKHAKEDKSEISAGNSFRKLSALEPIDVNSLESKKEHAGLYRLALVSSKSAALKEVPKEASSHLSNAIKVLLDHYPVSSDENEARERGKIWEGAIVGNQSAQLVCLRDMLSLLDFVAKVFPSEEINYLSQQILNLLLQLSEEKSSEIFALISLIEKAEYKRAAEAFKVYSEKYCSTDNESGLDHIITTSSRFLERTIKEQDAKNGLFALENLFRVFLKDKSYVKRMALDMGKAIFPGLRDEAVNKAAKNIREEAENIKNLEVLISSLLKLSYVSIGDEKVEKI